MLEEESILPVHFVCASFPNLKTKNLNMLAKSRMTFAAPPPISKEKNGKKMKSDGKIKCKDLRANEPSISSSCHPDILD